MRPPPPQLLDDGLDFGDDFEDMQPRKTAAELLLEERQYKARRVARIEQLESKGSLFGRLRRPKTHTPQASSARCQTMSTG